MNPPVFHQWSWWEVSPSSKTISPPPPLVREKRGGQLVCCVSMCVINPRNWAWLDFRGFHCSIMGKEVLLLKYWNIQGYNFFFLLFALSVWTSNPTPTCNAYVQRFHLAWMPLSASFHGLHGSSLSRTVKSDYCISVPFSQSSQTTSIPFSYSQVRLPRSLSRTVKSDCCTSAPFSQSSQTTVPQSLSHSQVRLMYPSPFLTVKSDYLSCPREKCFPSSCILMPISN